MKTIIKLLVISLISFIAANCGISDPRVFPYISGTITIDSSIAESDVKIGVFDNANMSSTYDTAYDNRRYYIDDTASSGEVLVDTAPNTSGELTTMTITNSNGDEETFDWYVNFDSNPDTTKTYRVAAWVDADGDGKLKLIDSWYTSDILLGEFNRAPVYSSDAITSFTADSNGVYSFKSSWSTVDLKESNANNFSFDLTPESSGW